MLPSSSALHSHAAQRDQLFLILNASTRLHVSSERVVLPFREFCPRQPIFLVPDDLQLLCALFRFSKLLTLSFLLFQLMTAVQLFNSFVLESHAAQRALLQLPLFLMLSASTRFLVELASFPLHEFFQMRLIFLALDGLQPLGALAKSSMLDQPSLVLQPHASFVLQSRVAR